MKKAIRIILSIILFIPAATVIWLSISVFGMIALFAIIVGYLYPFAWLIDNKEAMEQCEESWYILGSIILAHFLFFNEFIKGNNPFECM